MANKIKGTKGNDVLTGDAQENEIDGGDGNDKLYGLGGNDELKGGDGNDHLEGGDGNDRLKGEKGIDVLLGGQGMDVLEGGDDNDTLGGGLDADLLDGGKGNDLLEGNEGNDILAGNKGNDRLLGGAGNDVLLGDGKISGSGKKWGTVTGTSSGSGSGSGSGKASGSGASSTSAEWTKWATVGSGSSGSGAGADYLDGGAGNDIIYAGGGTDTGRYQVTENVGAKDLYDGGKGIDTLELDLTLAQWLDPKFQGDLANYLNFLEVNTNTKTGVANTKAFNFTAFDLTASAWEKLKVSVDGVNTNPADEAVAAKNDAFATNEDTAISGNVLNNNGIGPDLIPDYLRAVTLVTGPNGSLVLNANGTFTYDPANAYQYLAAGETAVDTFTYRIEDADGDTSTATVSITVTGINDAPMIGVASQAGSVTEIVDLAAGENTADLTSTGTMAFTDVDLSDAHTVTVTPAGAGFRGALTATVSNVSTGDGAGVVTWDYKVNDSAVDNLAAGQTLTQVYTVKIDDGKGGSASRDVTITITGTNDAPVIGIATETGAVTELADNAPNENTADLTSAGTMAFTDVDLNDAHTITITPAGAGFRGALTATVTNPATGDGAGVVGWDYTVKGAAVDNLAAGQTLSQLYSIKIDDGKGGSANRDVTITLTGTNDAPVIGVANQAGSVTEIADNAAGENTADLTSTGTLAFTDVDLTDAHSVTVTPAGTGFRGTLIATVSTASTNIGAGVVTWDYKVNDSALDDLAAGQTLTQVYSVTLGDGNGGSVSRDVTISINGSNDAPTVQGVSVNAIEDGAAVTGSFSGDDVDSDDDGNSLVYNIVGSPDKGTLTNNGNGTFSFDPGKNFQALAAGETTDITLSYKGTDSHGAQSTAGTLAIKVTGVNDAPTMASGSMAATEDGAAVTLSLSTLADDVDSDDDGNSLAYTLLNSAPGGSASITGSTLTFNPGSDFQTLGKGKMTSFDLDVKATDKHGAEANNKVKVTVTGVNDAPVALNDTNTLKVTSLANQVNTTTVNWVDWTSASAGQVNGVINLGGGQTVNVTYTGEFAFTQTNGGTGYYTTPASAPGDTLLGTGTYTSAKVANGPTGSDIIALSSSTQKTLSFSTPVNNLFFAIVSLNGNGYLFDQDFDILSYGRGFWGNGPAGKTALPDGRFALNSTGGPNGNELHGVIGIKGSVSSLTWTSLANEYWNGFTIGTYGKAQTAIANGNLLANDSDIDVGDSIHVSAVNGQQIAGNSVTLTLLSGASINVNKNGSYSYDENGAFGQLAKNETFVDSFTYTTKDSEGATDGATATITVTGINDAPTMAAGTMAATEDGPAVTLNLAPLGDDIDSDDNGASLTYSLVGAVPAASGSAVITGTTLSFNPGSDFQSLAKNQTSTLVLNVKATDQHGAEAVNKVTVTVTGINDIPTVQGVAVVAVEDGAAVTGSFSGDDIDSDDNGSSLVYSISGAPALGTLANNGNGTFTYNPGTNFQTLALGETTHYDLSYTGKDKHGAVSVPGNLKVTVTGVNDAPTMTSGTLGATEDGSVVTLNLAALGNDIDSDDDGGSLTYSLVGPAPGSAGTASISGSDFSFNPGTDFQSLGRNQTRDVIFNVKATDSHGASSAVNTVKVTVTGVNDAPVITGGDSSGAVTATPGASSFKVEQWTGFTGPYGIANLKSHASANAANYTVTTNIIDYTDDPGGFAGELPGSTQWPAAVATGASGTGGINNHFFARVTGQLSVASADTYTFRTFNDDGVYLYVNNTLVINDPNQHGEQAFTGNITLTPGVYPIELYFFENGGEASLEFTYKNSTGTFGHVNTSKLTDGGVLLFGDVDLTDTHTVTVVPGGITLGALTAAVTMDTTGVGTGGKAAWNYSVDNTAVAYLGAGQTLVENFVVTVNDGKGGTAPQTVAVTINGVNDLPEAKPDTAVTNEDNAVTISVLVNDTDVDSGDTKALVSASNGANGTVTLSGSNVVYTPNLNFNGTDSFSYIMRDTAGATSTASVTVTVNPVNDGPVINFLDAAIINGSFEGNTNGWTASQINFIGDWQTNHGNNVLDMNAESGGGFVEQTLQTVAGRQYTVNFALSKNPGSPAGTETLRVSAAGTSQDYVFNAVNTPADMKWSQQSFTFTATGASTVLRLAGTDPAGGDAWGPALDNVRLAAQMSAYEDTATAIKGLSIGDIDAGNNQVRLTLSVGQGTLSISGSNLSGDLDGGDGILSITGSQADINAALVNGLAYKGNLNYFGADSLSVTLSDQGHTGAGGSLLASKNISINVVPVNDAPNISFAGLNIVNPSFETGTTGWVASQINHIGDWDAANGFKTLDMNAENGGGFVQQNLQTVVGATYTVGFALSKNPGAPTGVETLRVSAAGVSEDYVYSDTNSQGDMKWAYKTFTFTATSTTTTLRFASADAAGGTDAWGPALDDIMGLAAAAGSATTISGLSIADIDAGTNPIKLSLSVSHGTLNFSGLGLTAIDGDGNDGTLVYTGALAAINAALLNGLVYTPDSDYSGTETLTAVIDDMGATGGGSLIDTQSVYIQIIGVAALPS